MNTAPLTDDEQSDLAHVMDGREYICISNGRKKGQVFCNISPTLAADKRRAAQILRAAAALLDGKNPERMTTL